MSTVRGRGRSLEIAVDRALAAAVEELRAQFEARGEFYRGSRAVANLGILEPPAHEIAAFRDLLAEYGITLDGVSGVDAIAGAVAELDLAYLGLPSATASEVAALPRQRADRRVLIERGALNLGQALDIARALVDARGHAAGKAGIDLVVLAGDDIAGVAKTVADIAGQIARVRGTENR